MEESIKKIIEDAALKEEIYPRKYGSGTREGYSTMMLYEINSERSECFEKGAIFGYNLATTTPTTQEYRANFLFGFDDDSIESLGYELANGKTEAYLKEVWQELVDKIKNPSPPTTQDGDKDVKGKIFLDVLVENYQAQIAGFYNDDKTDAERAKRNAVIEEYQDLIAIFKQSYLPSSQPKEVKAENESPVQKDETIIAFIPCDENDERMVGGFTSTDGTSLCYVRELKLKI